MAYKPQAGAQVSAPNVVPMADIMLVLLIIIMVAVSRDGTLYLGNTKIAKENITNEIKDQIANKLDKTVYVKSDARAKYGDVVAVVDEIRSAGVDQLGLLTEKSKSTSPRAQENKPAAGGQL